MRTPVAAFPDTRAEGFGDDFLDGSSAPPAFRAATETAVNLLRGARDIVGRGHGGADVVVAQNITRTNDHGEKRTRLRQSLSDIEAPFPMQRKNRLFEAIPN